MIRFIALLLPIIFFASCEDGNLEAIPYNPTPYENEAEDVLGEMTIPANNPSTYEGVKLGQHLFYDPILSADNSMSCASCHHSDKAFTDGLSVSTGIQGLPGSKSSMSLVNIGYSKNGLFWNGRSPRLEEQAIHPIEDPLELNFNWEAIVEKLQDHDEYPKMFREAFGIAQDSEITKALATKAIAQFERAIVSYQSIYDLEQLNLEVLTDDELKGKELYFDLDPLTIDAGCAHCHGDKLLTANDYFNNGIQVYDPINGFKEPGRGLVTGFKADNGAFKAPTLRNIALTAPYMHDGRFETLEEVIEHYNSGGHYAPNLDVNVSKLNLSEYEKKCIIDFLHTLTDTSYLENELIVDPFK